MSKLGLLDGPGDTGSVSVTTTAAEAKIGGSALVGRQALVIQPIDGDIYWGYDSGITSSTGHLIPEGTTVMVQAGALLPVYLVAASGTIDTRLSEVG